MQSLLRQRLWRMQEVIVRRRNFLRSDVCVPLKESFDSGNDIGMNIGMKRTGNQFTAFGKC